MKTKIEDRWNALVKPEEKPIFQLFDAEHPLNIYIGRAITGERLLLVIDVEQPPPLKSMKSLEISCSKREDGHWNLLLTLRRNELEEVFGLLCEDLISSSRNIPNHLTPIQFISRRISAWLKLTEQGKNGLLSESEVRGLMGELIVLEKFISSGTNIIELLTSWVGPLGADQDFQFSDTAWEVKTIQLDAPSFQVASERQLHTEERQLFLAVVSLKEGGEDGSVSLNAMVAKLRGFLQSNSDALDFFDDRLSEIGYASRHEYDGPSFHVGRIRLFSVKDGFPRLTPESLPSGLLDLNYRILLESCKEFSEPVPDNWK